MSKYFGVDIARNISGYINEKLNYGLEVDEILNGEIKNNEGDINMMHVEILLIKELREYEIADRITNPEMIKILTSLDNDLSEILSDYLQSWFQSSNRTLIKMQTIVKTYKKRADDLLDYKYENPAESNRFILELVELQYKYAKEVTSTSIVNNAIRQCFYKEMKYLLIKKKVYEPNKRDCMNHDISEINKVDNEINQNIKDNTITKVEEDIELKDLLKEIMYLRQEVQDLKNKVNKKGEN